MRITVFTTYYNKNMTREIIIRKNEFHYINFFMYFKREKFILNFNIDEQFILNSNIDD